MAELRSWVARAESPGSMLVDVDEADCLVKVVSLAVTTGPEVPD